jgi:DNA (cytosine-5)-methyltransferase 1
MRYASVFDGIGAAHVAWQPLGWECAWTAEIDAFPSAVVEQRWGFENRGDVTKFKEWTDGEAIDLLVGGSPCQSFSVAGLRQGLLDPRGGLMLTFLGIAQRYRPQWVVWENVPGVLSSGQGRDFGSFLGALAELGYGFAYRVLDAQWFGVAQRRRRVFVVGCLGDMRSAAKVLFECESVRRDNPPSREKGERITGAITARSGRTGGASNDDLDAGKLLAYTSDGVLADPISANEGRTYTHEGTTFRMHNCVSQPFTKSKSAQSNKDDETWVPGEAAPTFNVFDSGETRATTVVAEGFTYSGYSNQPAWMTGNRTDCPSSSGHSDGSHQGLGVVMPGSVRRLTPRECERLQGFPDDYTLVTHRGKPAADGPRYRALGNSMAVPVMRWIGERIARGGA